jgi:hypothetical protein
MSAIPVDTGVKVGLDCELTMLARKRAPSCRRSPENDCRWIRGVVVGGWEDESRFGTLDNEK